MDKSMWTSYFVESTPEEAVRLLAEKGWRTVELSTEHSQTLLDRGNVAATARDFLRHCGDLGVSVPQAHFKLGARIANPDAAERRAELHELKGWIDLYRELGVAAGVLHPGGLTFDSPGPLTDELMAVNVESLGVLLDHAAGGPTTICLENGGWADELVRLIETAGPEGLGICLDTGHLALLRAMHPDLGQTDYEFVTIAGPHLRALHVTDNDGSGDQHMLPLPDGRVDWDGLLRGLREVGFDGPFNFEIPGESRCPVPERLEKLDTAARIASTLLANPGVR